MNRAEGFLLGVVIGGLLTALIPDIPTSLEFWSEKPAYRPVVACTWIAVLGLIAVAATEYAK